MPGPQFPQTQKRPGCPNATTCSPSGENAAISTGATKQGLTLRSNTKSPGNGAACTDAADSFGWTTTTTGGAGCRDGAAAGAAGTAAGTARTAAGGLGTTEITVSGPRVVASSYRAATSSIVG